MARDLGDLVVSLSKMPGAIGEAQGRAVRAAAAETKSSILSRARIDTGGDFMLSGTGRRRAKLGVRYRITGTAEPTAWVKATGWAWPLIERDTKAHSIPREARRKRRRRYYMAFGGSVYSRVDHPGTRGKHTFARGVAAAEPEVPRIFQREIRKAIGRTFG